MPVVLNSSAKPLSDADFSQLSFNRIERDWFGNAVSTPPQYKLAIDPKFLWFGARRLYPPQSSRTISAGTFEEGLWNEDVAELFLCDDAISTRYAEINLAPSGAYWRCEFESYRTRAKGGALPVENIQARGQVGASGWEASLRVPRRELSITFSGERASRGNVSFILRGPRLAYFTAHGLKASHPDFHLTEQFETFEIHPIDDAVSR